MISFFTNQRTRLALGVILCVLAIALLISTISYLKNGSLDQSLVQGRTITEVTSASAQIENVGGPTGAFVTNMLFADGIGLGALVSVFYLSVLGLSLFGFMRCRFWAFTFKCLFTAISISIVLGLLTYNAETVTCWGGQHGHYINQWLMNVSGTLGAICVSVILLGLLAVMYLTQLISFYNIVSGKLARRRQAMTDAAAEARKPVVALADVPEQNDVKDEPKQTEAVEKSEETPAEKAEEPQKEPQQIGFSIDEMDSSQSSQSAAEPAKPGEPEFTIHTTAIEGVDNPDESKPINLEPYNVRDELSHYRFPGLDLLIDRPVTSVTTEQEQEDNKRLITKTLADYNIA
ncbi:MAG: DNA translocase FtsK 4TM domain-containing protein, partial [Muribaculaceae bacterium]